MSIHSDMTLWRDSKECTYYDESVSLEGVPGELEISVEGRLRGKRE